jgi:hypothetical protein
MVSPAGAMMVNGPRSPWWWGRRRSASGCRPMFTVAEAPIVCVRDARDGVGSRGADGHALAGPDGMDSSAVGADRDVFVGAHRLGAVGADVDGLVAADRFGAVDADGDGLVVVHRLGAVVLDVVGLVVVDGLLAVMPDPVRLVVLDFDVLVLLGMQPQLLGSPSCPRSAAHWRCRRRRPWCCG